MTERIEERGGAVADCKHSVYPRRLSIVTKNRDLALEGVKSLLFAVTYKQFFSARFQDKFEEEEEIT
jgi:hypothetical protein